ncbi:hypothetical protein [Candidatus Igneacidithiobacillus taiwanensis]|uniref:hypothetical protein n=1 Tax=Candidatus Igneacidithiobacillus taiwanensis TaxID=1945924 RepID=UPI002896D5B4|nr:hypothetical protein [Candidatus Igneacidithiobacillus taiwanensis]
MTEIETRLMTALDALSEQLQQTTKRLETMTRNYEALSKRMQSLETSINSYRNSNQSMIEKWNEQQASQSALEQQLKRLREQLGSG